MGDSKIALIAIIVPFRAKTIAQAIIVPFRVKNSPRSSRNALTLVEYSGLEPLTSTLPVLRSSQMS